MKDLEKRIEELLPEGKWRIFDAMRYTPLAGGKRLRGKIILSVAEDIGVEDVLDIAAAVEIFHAGTLVHDDMPEIDDATLRRGKKASHLVFGEGLALLAGDGLFFRSFEIIAGYPELFKEFSKVAMEVLIGEAMDVEMEELEDVSENDIYEMYEKKTGALFGFSFCSPVIIAGLSWGEMENLGRKFGVAFQIYDDLKDLREKSENVGKDVGKDVNKKTIVKKLGPERAEEQADEMVEEILKDLKDRGFLKTYDLISSAANLIKRG
jgi:geranylgeranyl diphosphate synthase type II